MIAKAQNGGHVTLDRPRLSFAVDRLGLFQAGRKQKIVLNQVLVTRP